MNENSLLSCAGNPSQLSERVGHTAVPLPFNGLRNGTTTLGDTMIFGRSVPFAVSSFCAAINQSVNARYWRLSRIRRRPDLPLRVSQTNTGKPCSVKSYQRPPARAAFVGYPGECSH